MKYTVYHLYDAPYWLTISTPTVAPHKFPTTTSLTNLEHWLLLKVFNFHFLQLYDLIV